MKLVNLFLTFVFVIGINVAAGQSSELQKSKLPDLPVADGTLKRLPQRDVYGLGQTIVTPPSHGSTNSAEAILIGTKPIAKKRVPVLQHPHRVNVPNDLPFVETVELFEKDGSSHVERVFPCVEYQNAHYRGWQSCLGSASLIGSFGFQSSGDLLQDIDSLQYGPISTNRPHLNRGGKAGFVACRQAIKNLAIRGESLKRIQELCQEAYGPIEPVPPPAQQGGRPKFRKPSL